jgi:hypothetical protein
MNPPTQATGPKGSHLHLTIRHFGLQQGSAAMAGTDELARVSMC